MATLTPMLPLVGHASQENLSEIPKKIESNLKKCYSCAVCDKTFTNFHRLKGHLQRHIEEGKIYICKLCNNKYRCKNNLNLHMRSHGINPIRCKYCTNTFRETRQYLQHCLKKHGVEITDFQCKICLDVFSSFGLLFSHCNRKHNSDMEGNVQNNIGKDLNSIENSSTANLENQSFVKNTPTISTKPADEKQNNVRKMSLASNKELVVVLERSNKVESLVLDKTKDSKIHNGVELLNDNHDLEKNVKQDSEIQNGGIESMDNINNQILETNATLHTDSQLNYYRCEICQEALDVELLRLHRTQKHPEVKTFRNVCHLCGKNLASLRTLTTHMNVHYGVLLYSCPHCTQKCSSATSLSLHKKKSHAAERNAALETKKPDPCFSVCSVCNQQVCSQPEFRKHKAKHGNKTPVLLLCVFEQCKKTFSVFYSARCHGYLHIGRKPFKCDYCSMAYSVPGSLQGHIRTFHREKMKYICKKCGVVFQAKLWYLKHRLMNCMGKEDGIRKRRTDGRKMPLILQNSTFRKIPKPVGSTNTNDSVSNNTTNTEAPLQLFGPLSLHNKIQIPATKPLQATYKLKPGPLRRKSKSMQPSSLSIEKELTNRNDGITQGHEGSTSSLDLVEHLTVEIDDPGLRKKFQCLRCNKMFDSKRGVMKHISFHSIKRKQVVTKPSTNNTLSTETTTNIHECSICKLKFQSLEMLVLHFQRDHLDSDLNPKSNVPLNLQGSQLSKDTSANKNQVVKTVVDMERYSLASVIEESNNSSYQNPPLIDEPTTSVQDCEEEIDSKLSIVENTVVSLPCETSLVDSLKSALDKNISELLSFKEYLTRDMQGFEGALVANTGMAEVIDKFKESVDKNILLLNDFKFSFNGNISEPRSSTNECNLSVLEGSVVSIKQEF